MKKHWLTVRNAVEGPTEILIQGTIGKDWMDDSGISEKEFTDAISEIPEGKKIVVGINSQGGSVKDGLGIYHAIQRRRQDVTCRVDGYAVSIASVIALAGGRTVTPKSAMWMIHEPWSMAQGNADDMRKAAEMLDIHGETLASIYSEHTGKDKESVRAAMKSETWFTGEEAHSWGLTDEQTDEDVEDALASVSIDLNEFRHPPVQLVAMLRRRDAVDPNAQDAAQSSGENTQQMNRDQIVAMLKKRGVTVDAKATDEQLLAQLENLLEASGTKPNTEEKTELDSLRAEMKKIRDAAESDRVNRITAEVTALCSTRNLKSEDWIAPCLSNEKLIENLRNIPEPMAGTSPINLPTGITTRDYRDEIASKKMGWERIHFLRDNWNELRSAESSMRRFGVRGANTTSATIKTSMLNTVVTTVLQDQLAPLAAFGMDVSADAYKPLATVVSKKITAGGTAGTDATDFEDETNFVATGGPISVTMHQYTAGGHLTNAELLSGWRITDWSVIKAAEIANAVWDVVSALFTTANFTADPLVSAAAAFSADDMNTLWGKIQKAPVKNLVIDGTYFCRLLGKNTLDFNNQSGDVRTVRWPGWGTVGYSTRWSAAGSGVYGIACAPQVARLVTGLPLTAPTSNAAGLIQSTATTQLGISIQVNEWFGLAARTDWVTYDIMFGAAVDDTTAGVLVKGA